MGGDPISAGNLDGGGGGGDLIPAGNLDGESHTCMRPRWGDSMPAGNLDVGIPYLQET